MSKSHVVTARLDEETMVGLTRLADFHERSRAWLVAKAVSSYVEQEIEFLDFVKEGEDAAERGELISQEEMERWFEEKVAARKAQIVAE